MLASQVYESHNKGAYQSASIQISLQTAIGPGVDGLVKSVLGGLGRGVGSLRSGRADVGGSGTECRSGGTRNGVTKDLGAVLADQSAQLVELGTLGDYRLLALMLFIYGVQTPTIDAVLVTELF